MGMFELMLYSNHNLAQISVVLMRFDDRSYQVF